MHELRIALLAGGLGQRMGRLGQGRLKPLVPFGGACHLIDFSLHNARASGAHEVLLMAQHNEAQLLRYLLASWCQRPGFRVHFGLYDDAQPHTIEALFAERPRPPEHGTADALIANAPYLFERPERDLMVLHADHVYRFDYRPMLARHRASGAALTLGYQRIAPEFVKLFGMVAFNAAGQLTQFIEKPAEPRSDTVFTAVCIFRRDILWRYLQALQQGGDWQHDISRDVIPAMLAGGERIVGHAFTGYWEDIGTVPRYWQAHQRLLDATPSLRPEELPQTLAPGWPMQHVAQRDGVLQSLLPSDLRCEGARIEHSVVYPGAQVAPGARVRHSVLLPGARVGAGDVLERAILLEPGMPGAAQGPLLMDQDFQ